MDRLRRLLRPLARCLWMLPGLVHGLALADPAVAEPERWQALAHAGEPAPMWQWDAQQVQLPGGARCGRPVHEFLRLEAPALMQGTLGAVPQVAERRALALGLRHLPVATQRVSCDNASFDLHHLNDGQALLAWDSQVHRLRRLPATGRTAGTALGTVQRLLLTHFNSPMGFSAPRVRAVERWLSPSLTGAITRHFARPRPRDAVPAVPLDAFTGADEIPSRTWFEPAVQAGDAAHVVMHAELEGSGRPDHRITYVLRRQRGAWLVDDVQYLDGRVTLRELLAR